MIKVLLIKDGCNHGKLDMSLRQTNLTSPDSRVDKIPRSCELRTRLSTAPMEVLLYPADRQGLKGRILCFGIFLCLPLKNG